MNLLDRIVNKMNAYFHKQGIRMIRYADDFLLMAKHINEESPAKLESLLGRMGLTLNTDKSKRVNALESSFDFLGFTFRYDLSPFAKGKRFWNIVPKAKSEQKIRQKVNERLKQIGHFPAFAVVAELKPILRGWMYYYRIDKVSYTQISFKNLEDYLRIRLTRFYNRKSQGKSSLYGVQAFAIMVKYQTSGRRPVHAQQRKL